MTDYIRQVTANLKGKIDVKLGQKTLITGANGSGKSAIVQAVQLALTGSIGLEDGRSVSLASDIFDLSPERTGVMNSTVVFASGAQAYWQSEGSVQTAKRATHYTPDFLNPETVMPVQNLRDELSKGVAGQREFFFRKVAASISEDQVLTALPSELAKDYSGFPGFPGEKLIAMQAHAKQTKLALSRQEKSEKALADSGSVGLLPPVPASRIAQLQRIVEENAIPVTESFDAGTCSACGQSLDALRHTSSEEMERIERYQTASMALNEAISTNAGWARAKKTAQDVRITHTELERWSAIEGACQDASTLLLRAGLASVKERVQRHLPPVDVFDLILNQGTREVCRFGFQRNGFLDHALSGAEWARVMIAIAAGLSPDGYKCLTVEDRAWDPDSLQRFMASLREVDGQVLVTSPTKPTSTPSGWVVLEV